MTVQNWWRDMLTEIWLCIIDDIAQWVDFFLFFSIYFFPCVFFFILIMSYFQKNNYIVFC